MMAIRIFAVLFYLLATTNTYAGYQEGAAAYGAQKYDAALNELIPAADAGDVNAQVLLGNMYENGLGGAVDLNKAFSLYQKSANSGNAFAQSRLGYMYYNGQGVSQDYIASMTWFKKAAENSNSAAMAGIADQYYFCNPPLKSGHA